MVDHLVAKWGHNSDCKLAELLENSKAALLVERVVELKAVKLADLLAESTDDIVVETMVDELVCSLVVSKVAL